MCRLTELNKPKVLCERNLILLSLSRIDIFQVSIKKMNEMNRALPLPKNKIRTFK